MIVSNHITVGGFIGGPAGESDWFLGEVTDRLQLKPAGTRTFENGVVLLRYLAGA